MNNKIPFKIKALEEKHKNLDKKIMEMESHHDSNDIIKTSKKAKLKLKEKIEYLKKCRC